MSFAARLPAGSSMSVVVFAHLGVDVAGYASSTNPSWNSPNTQRGSCDPQIMRSGQVGMYCKDAAARGVGSMAEQTGPATWIYTFFAEVPFISMPGSVDVGAGFLVFVKVNGTFYPRTGSSTGSGFRRFDFTIPFSISETEVVRVEFL
jgi:hypothetical protein